jgi:secernin
MNAPIFDRIKAITLSCDTLVSVAGGGSKHTIFAKNSDRLATECQPLFYAPRTRHPASSTVQCQYMRIPQARDTFGILGGRPWWLWGFEQGVNDAGVAIGNEAIYTKDPIPEQGLLGMDLVRLGLERGGTAHEAKDVITALLEQYGQGGVAVRGTDRRYHNSFIIADPTEAWILETSARHWVAKRVRGAAAIANLVTIEDDWDDASAGIQQYARERGWWQGAPDQKLNFRQAFEDPQIRPATEPRYHASCRFLAGEGPITVTAMKRHLRDHFESGQLNIAYPGRPRTVCMHPGEYPSSTAASLVVELRPDSEPIVAWSSMATPCTGVFVPVVLGTPLPESLTTGSESRMDGSLWWTMRFLQRVADRDSAKLASIVQREWSAWEAQLEHAAASDADALRLQLGTIAAELMHRATEMIGDLPHNTTEASQPTAIGTRSLSG